MPNVHTRYVTWGRQGRRRHAGAAAVDMTPPVDSIVADNGPYGAWAAPSLAANGTQSAFFAFWSVIGLPGGPMVSTNPTLSVMTGTTNVEATAWYIPTGGGGGNGQPGAYIDAFDVQVGTFVDDDFVDVVSNPALTAAANDTGFVPTATADDIQAYNSIHAVPLDGWALILPPATVANPHLQVGQGASPIAFAFYKSGTINPPRFRGDSYARWVWVSKGVMVDGGGPTGGGPVDPWGPFMQELAVGLDMASSARLVRKEFRAQAMKLAADQFKKAAADIAHKIEQH